MVTTTINFERATLILAVTAVVLCLVVPIVVVSVESNAQHFDQTSQSTEVTVGIAVILRATARRLLKSGTKSALRTTVGTFSRTVARTLTRRLVRFVMHSLVGLFSKRTIDSAREDLSSDDADASEIGADAPLMATPVALGMGFVALCASFWGVLQVVPDATRNQILHEGRVDVFSACLLAGLPLIVFCLVFQSLARIMGLKFRVVTEIDGILIQGYFTGAGSFLPVTTDIECEGSTRQKAWVSLLSLSTMYALHLILMTLSWQFDSDLVGFCSGMFLVYCFVYSFPITPLQGHDVWKYSGLLWLLVFVPVLISFLFAFPTELSQII